MQVYRCSNCLEKTTIRGEHPSTLSGIACIQYGGPTGRLEYAYPATLLSLWPGEGYDIDHFFECFVKPFTLIYKATQ
jgi:hypothetical protein